MLHMLGRGLASVVLFVIVYIALGGVMSAYSAPRPRGERIEIESGRSLRLICEGPRSTRPVVWLEAGAFGFSADFGATQAALVAAGWRTCAYDRAGMGYSDPGPAPRDGLAIVSDFEKLADRSGEVGPYILVGHSMAGLRLREYAGRNPDRVAGLVFLDAATPEAAAEPRVVGFIKAFATASRWAARGAALGLYKPLSHTGLGDKIGLPASAKAEKRWAFGNGRHNRTAADEVALWLEASNQAAAQPPLNPEWPVAVLTAGPVKGREEWKAIQAAPARAARHGMVEHVEAASHTRLLGQGFADHIVRAVAFVADPAGADTPRKSD